MPLAVPVQVSFGKVEGIHCITDVALRGPADQALCLAYKTSSYAVLVPLYLKDDGYVLAVRPDLKSYFPLPPGLAAAQESGLLPRPLPGYSIPFEDYATGYVVWLVVGVMVAAALVRRRVKKSRLDALAALAPSSGPLALRTETDRWLAEESAKLLEEGEAVELQAYGLDKRDASQATRAMYVVVTNRRLLVMRSRLVGHAPKKENLGLQSHDIRSVERVVLDERQVRFFFRDASVFDFFVDWSERHLSNQRRFLVDLSRLFASG